MTYTACPCCSAKTSKAHPNSDRVRICNKCSAEYGDVGYKGDLYSWIGMGQWATASVPPEALLYVDFSYVGSEGEGRFHGWLDRYTRKIVQTG
jgi:hypothetical protein